MIRRAKETDRDILIDLMVKSDLYHIELGDKERSINELIERNSRMIDSNINKFYVIEEDSVIGTVMVWDNNEEITLNNLYIREEYRGKGYCSELINYILKDIKEDYIVLGVYPNNIIANNVYRHLGFKLLQDTGDLLWLIKERKNEYV